MGINIFTPHAHQTKKISCKNLNLKMISAIKTLQSSSILSINIFTLISDWCIDFDVRRGERSWRGTKLHIGVVLAASEPLTLQFRYFNAASVSTLVEWSWRCVVLCELSRTNIFFYQWTTLVIQVVVSASTLFLYLCTFCIYLYFFFFCFVLCFKPRQQYWTKAS